MAEINPDGYLEMRCGIKIPYILVYDWGNAEMKVAPSKALPMIQDGMSNLIDEEAEEIDNNVFFWADTFERSEAMLSEIKESSDVEVTFEPKDDEEEEN